MTEPMNPAALAAMVADMQAGTHGPWHEAQTWRPPIGNGPHDDMVNGKIFWGYSICGSNEHGGHIYPTLASVHNFPDHIHANARRIARVPAMEQTIIALSAQLAAVTAERDAAVARVLKSERERDDASLFLDNAISKAPEPLIALGEWLANLLDEDDWPTAERYLNAAIGTPT